MGRPHVVILGDVGMNLARRFDGGIVGDQTNLVASATTESLFNRRYATTTNYTKLSRP